MSQEADCHPSYPQVVDNTVYNLFVKLWITVKVLAKVDMWITGQGLST